MLHHRQIRTGTSTLVAFALAATLAVDGCGGSATRSSSTGASGGQSLGSSTNASPPAPQTSGSPEPTPPVTIEVAIPALLPGSRIPTRYTCDGANVSLPVRWSQVPSGFADFAIFVVNLQPVHGKLFFDWAVADLSRTSHGLLPGKLPPGAVVGRNSFDKAGYSICPAKGTSKEHYAVRVVALNRALAVKPGFNPEAAFQEAERSAKAVGLAGGAYTPPRT
jgi:phosphatidylethanolamine-binding protein (PEBP) family uncharacterized protein